MAHWTPVTPKKRARFLALLAEGHAVKHAAEGARVSRQAMYRDRTADAEFAAAWEGALEEGTEVLEQEARRRAVEGVTKTKGVYHQGVCIDICVETEYSDTLLIFLLKARRPETYRERHDIQMGLSGEVTVRYVNDWRTQNDASDSGR